MIEFSNPVSVMHADILNYLEVNLVNGIYEPPIPLDVLAKATKANSIHGSALHVKTNMAVSISKLNSILKRRDYKRFISDYLTFGNGYLNVVRNVFGEAVEIKHLPALFMRRCEDLRTYVYKPKEFSSEGEIYYKHHQVFHLCEYDHSQEIYGLAQYLGALFSIWLNEDATLFRRQYYLNGNHAGYLFYTNEPTMTKKDEDDIKAKLKEKNGAFKNIYINAKGKDSKPPELTPIGQVEAKDEFKNIKSMTTNDVLAAHRIPLDLMSIVREGFTTSGDLNKVDRIFYKNELVPLLESVSEINDFVGFEVVGIKEYSGLDEVA